jgi:hypothetical protein
MEVGTCVFQSARAAMSGFSLSNRLDQAAPSLVAQDSEMKVLKDMNDLQEFKDDVWSKGTV